MKRSALVCIAAALSASALAQGVYPNTSNFGVPFSEEEDWFKQCMRVEHLPPAAATPKASPGCDPLILYDRKRSQASTSQAEWDQVRACAVARDDDAVLMMLYANGYGVPRDYGRAIHHACSLDFIAKAEMADRIAHLAKGQEGRKPFDLCDDITSGVMGAKCAERRETQDKRVRQGRLDRAARSLPDASRAAFATLRMAAGRYATEAGHAETDAHGTLAAAFAFQRQARLREQAMQAMLDTMARKLAPVRPEEYAARDRELNQVYGELMAIPSAQDGWPDRIGNSTIAHADVRKAERLWLAYRDAFAAFDASLSSASSSDAIKALLTIQRIAELRDVERYR